MFERRKLGTTYTKSPAQKIKKWLVDNLAKIAMAMISGLVWLVIFYVVTGIIRFLGVKIAEWQDWEDVTVLEIYLQPNFFWINVLGFVIVVVYVLRDRLTKR